MLTDLRFKDLLDLNQPLLVVHGNSVTDVSSSALMEAHEAGRGQIAVRQHSLLYFSPQSFSGLKANYEALLAAALTSGSKAGQPIPDEIQTDFATDVFPAILKCTQHRPDWGCFWSQMVDGYYPCLPVHSIIIRIGFCSGKGPLTSPHRNRLC
jgi:hypothetical protein